MIKRAALWSGAVVVFVAAAWWAYTKLDEWTAGELGA